MRVAFLKLSLIKSDLDGKTILQSGLETPGCLMEPQAIPNIHDLI